MICMYVCMYVCMHTCMHGRSMIFSVILNVKSYEFEAHVQWAPHHGLGNVKATHVYEK